VVVWSFEELDQRAPLLYYWKTEEAEKNNDIAYNRYYRSKVEKYLVELETYETQKDNSVKPPSPPSIFMLYLKVWLCALHLIFFR
jgi:hypothetical protein